jgi:hypothetical protein
MTIDAAFVKADTVLLPAIQPVLIIDHENIPP